MIYRITIKEGDMLVATKYSVSLAKLIKDNGVEVIYTPKPVENITVISADVHRPGLLLTGYDDYFDRERIQILGLTEMAYLKDMNPDERTISIDRLLKQHPPAVVVTRKLEIYSELLFLAKHYEVPLLHTGETSSTFMSNLISYLNVELAPRVTRHGVLVEVYGEGILLLGESGVGKSETAIELVKRGHRLIADDAVEIRRVSSHTLVGSAPNNIRHFIELRGIGIINARRIFGMGAVKLTEKIDFVIQLELWDKNKVYDRMGLESETIDILGNSVPLTTIPVKPGRNLAIIIEVAAMNNRQKKMGYNAAKELMQSLGMEVEGFDAPDDDPWKNHA